MIDQLVELIKNLLSMPEVQSLIIGVLGFLFLLVVMDEITK